MILETLRQKIDKIDNRILSLIAQRFQMVKKIITVKQKLHKPIIDRQREKEILKRIEQRSEKLNISVILIRKLYKLIFDESKNLQK